MNVMVGDIWQSLGTGILVIHGFCMHSDNVLSTFLERFENFDCSADYFCCSVE